MNDRHDPTVTATATIKRGRVTLDGSAVATITERWSKSSVFSGATALMLKVTTVDFDAGTQWTIQAWEPDHAKATTTTAFGTVHEDPHDIEARVVKVISGRDVIAETSRGRSPPGGGRPVVRVSVGTDVYQLVPDQLNSWAKWWRVAATTKAALPSSGIAKLSRPAFRKDWSIAVSSPMPLSAILLHWHILTGDHRPHQFADLIRTVWKPASRTY